MFHFYSLYSGSSGNSLFVETSNTKILIDAGESAKKITEALSHLHVDVSDINAIFVTHEHTDHTKFRFLQIKKLGMQCQVKPIKFQRK